MEIRIGGEYIRCDRWSPRGRKYVIKVVELVNFHGLPRFKAICKIDNHGIVPVGEGLLFPQEILENYYKPYKQIMENV